jgi:protein involved in polysaccharide export with SLBB domain
MLRSLLGLLISLILGSLALAQDATAPSHSVDGAENANGQARPAADKLEYHLGAGDKVRIKVFGEESLSGEFLVPGGSGAIGFPLIGDVQASGLSVAELQATLTAKLKDGYLKDPRVGVEVLNYRPYYILGEVNKPGQYSYTNGLTVLNAVATANGFTYRANTHKVYIKRPNTPAEIAYDLKTTTPVEPGDTIRIGERFF